MSFIQPFSRDVGGLRSLARQLLLGCGTDLAAVMLITVGLDCFKRRARIGLLITLGAGFCLGPTRSRRPAFQARGWLWRQFGRLALAIAEGLLG